MNLETLSQHNTLVSTLATLICCICMFSEMSLLSNRYKIHIQCAQRFQYQDALGETLVKVFSDTPIKVDQMLSKHEEREIASILASKIQFEIRNIHSNVNGYSNSEYKVIMKPKTADVEEQQFHRTRQSFSCRLSQYFTDKFETILQQTFLPRGLGISRRFSPSHQTPIVFFNQKAHVCPTHYDRDNSILFVLKGKKEILLAHKRVVHEYSEVPEVNDYIHFPSDTGLYDGINPFDEEESSRRKKGWTSVIIEEGQCLFLPKHIVHSIRSQPNTIAISFQVETKTSNKLALVSGAEVQNMLDYVANEEIEEQHGSLVMDLVYWY